MLIVIFAKKCIFISFWIVKYCFYYSFTLYYCAIFYSLDVGFFQYHPGVKQFGSRSSPIVSRRQKSTLGGKELNTKLLVDTTFWLKPWLNITNTMFHTSPHIIQLS